MILLAAIAIATLVIARRPNIEVVVGAVSVAFVIILIGCAVMAKWISKTFVKPLIVMNDWMALTGTNGDIVFTAEELAVLDIYKDRRDEIGTLFRSFKDLIVFLNETCDELNMVADGKIDFDVTVRSDRDELAKALKKMLDDLNGMFGEMHGVSTQVSSGSQQIADGTQVLAQGSTEQAATIQQLSASVSDISEKTKTNAQMAGQAATLADTIKGNAKKGSRQMDEMVSAVNEISQASQSISKVIKVIDDIAFQTNILALNAAVEAARAGQHGKGFAVVADEVRTLAAKSAEAAKDTGTLISNSMEKAEYGARIARDTAESLAGIVSGINESSDIISKIADASELQFAGISQINTGIDQVAKVVQQSSATSEESAAAAQELSGQSVVLGSLLSRVKTKNRNMQTHGHTHGKRPRAGHGKAANNTTAFSLTDKY